MKVLNARKLAPRAHDTRTRAYVGRPSKWGNPFVVGRDGTRDEVVEKFRAWIVAQSHLMADLGELKGKDLVCWCSPAKCHADVLIELVRMRP